MWTNQEGGHGLGLGRTSRRELDQNCPDWTRLDDGGPMTGTVGEDQDCRVKKLILSLNITTVVLKSLKHNKMHHVPCALFKSISAEGNPIASWDIHLTLYSTQYPVVKLG